METVSSTSAIAHPPSTPSPSGPATLERVQNKVASEPEYECSRCGEFMFQDDIVSHHCGRKTEDMGEEESYDQEAELEIEYLDSDEDTEWPQEERRQLLKTYIKKLAEGGDVGSKSFWDHVKKDLKTTRSSIELLAKVRELERTWQRIRQGLEPTADFSFEKEMRCISVLVARNKIKNEPESDALDNDAGTASWTNAETLKLILLYKKCIPLVSKKLMTEKEMWTSLQIDLSGRFKKKATLKAIQARIKDLKRCLKVINDKKKMNLHTKWPLAEAVTEMTMEEARWAYEDQPSKTQPSEPEQSDDDTQLQDKNDPDVNPSDLEETEAEGDDDDDDADEDDDDKTETLRWTGQETKQLLKAYRRHMDALYCTPSNKLKRIVWMKIAAEVKMGEPRKCNPYLARMKVNNLKKTWKKHEKGGGRASWAYSRLMKDVMREEARAVIQGDGPPLDDSLASSSSWEEREEGANNPKKQRMDTDEPTWFYQYRTQAKRRHDEKMKLKMRLLEVLEGFVVRMQHQN